MDPDLGRRLSPARARFGLLYLRGGRWGERQVVPADWVAKSVARHVELERDGASRTVGYGYLWWILQADPKGSGKNIFAAMGFMGQYIFVVPEHDMVVVTTAGADRKDQQTPVEFLYSHILKAVRR